MYQPSFLVFDHKKTLRSEKFLSEMNEVIPWEKFEEVIKPHYYNNDKTVGRNKIDLRTMLKIYFLQQWYNLSDPMMEEMIYDRKSFQVFLEIGVAFEKVPDETTILKFRHLLEKNNLVDKLQQKSNEYLEKAGHLLQEGTIVDASLIKSSSSTKNKEKKRDPEMSSTRKNNNYHFGMKLHIGVDSQTGAIHSVQGTTAKDSDISQIDKLLHGKEKAIFGDKGYAKIEKKQKFRERGIYYGVADKNTTRRCLSNKQEKKNQRISSIRAKVEHPFQVIKVLWGYSKTRYRGIKKNLVQLKTMCMLVNYYRLRKRLLMET